MIKLCAFADEADNSLDGQIQALNDNGIGLIELRNVNQKNVVDLTVREAEDYRERLYKRGIRVWSLGSPLGKVDIDCDFDAYKAKIAHTYALADAFGCKNIRIFSFFKSHSQQDKVFEALNYMVEQADTHGIALCHENEKEIFGDVVERVEALHRAVPGLKLIYDPANYVQCGQDVGTALKRLRTKTFYYHIKDARYADGAVVPSGCGDGNIKSLIEGLPSEGETVLTVEPHLKVFAGYADIDATELKNDFVFESNRAAFDCAVNALKEILTGCGYVPNGQGGYIR